VDPRLDRPERHVEECGDLVVVELLHVAEHERLDELRVVGADDLECVQQVEPAAGDHARGARVGVRWQLVGGPLGGSSLEGAVGGAGAVGRHRVQPGREPAAAAEGVDLGGDQEQRVLGRLLGVLREKQHPAADPAYPGLDLGEDVLERRSVTGRGARDQVVELVGLHDFHPRTQPAAVPHRQHS
jgi:hypothetical protein